MTIGGASVGDHDVVKPACRDLGLEMVVEGVSVRPGKPTWFGRFGDGRRVLGLPGNPVSAMVCAELFAAPIIAAMEGAAGGDLPGRARLAAALPANGPREHYLRATLTHDAHGGLVAEAAREQDSALVSVLARAGGLIRRLPLRPRRGRRRHRRDHPARAPALNEEEGCAKPSRRSRRESGRPPRRAHPTSGNGRYPRTSGGAPAGRP